MKEIFDRYSVRKFKDTQISQEDIDKLLEAGMQAPSSNNSQPWEFYVVSNKEMLEELSKVAPHGQPIANAPLSIVLCNEEITKNNSYTLIDMGICAENIMLEAVTLGLGSVMVGIAPYVERKDKVKEILDLPEGLEAFAVLAIGYPDEEKVTQNRFNPDKVHYKK